jgi:DNA-directed RNA polymerase specialized sigma24 family protein
MAETLAEAIAAVEGPELDTILGYIRPRYRAAPTEEAVRVAFEDFESGSLQEIARMLSLRYRCHRTHAEDAVQDGLLALFERRRGLYREDPESWLGLLYQVARFRLIEIITDQERTASIEALRELGGDAALEGARPCVPPSLEAEEETRYGPMPEEGEGWSRTQIIAALQRFRDYHGRPPKVKECRAVHGLPRAELVYREFGDFASAVLEAGMVPESLGLRRRRWSATEAAGACLSFRWRHGYWPGWADVKRRPGELPSTKVMIRYFGSTRSAEVGLGAEAILDSDPQPMAA